MSRALIATVIPQDDSPYDPVIRVSGAFFNALFYFLNGFGHFPSFEKCEGPVTMAVVMLGDVEFGLTADVNGLWVELMQVEKESQVVVDEFVLRI